MNYSTLLNRSVDFDDFQPFFNAAYPDELDQQLNLALIQMLWDRAENNGYANHLTSTRCPAPRPPGPDPRRLRRPPGLDVDAEVEARTIGARIHQPAIADGRNPRRRAVPGD